MSMTINLEGRIAAVTGAGQGLGQAYAEALAAAGATVLVNDYNADLANAVAEGIVKAGGKAEAAPGDVSKPGYFDELVAHAVAKYKSFDIIVNNAGVGRPAMLWKMTDEEWDQVIAINQNATFRSIRAAARQMMAQKFGRIINITSAAALDGSMGQINYSATKGAIIAMTKSAAKELATYGITCNAIAPVASTPMTKTVETNEKFYAAMMARIPMKRFAPTSEIAPAVVYLASDYASYTTGHVMLVDGGCSM
ncbi:MAG: SDR family NAD(P)-dependent oxidoreductase [Georgfuchsia sp.]